MDWAQLLVKYMRQVRLMEGYTYATKYETQHNKDFTDEERDILDRLDKEVEQTYMEHIR